MKHLAPGFFALMLIILDGCIGATGPLFSEVASTLPPVAADKARIYFYRQYEPYESLSQANLYLNGGPVAVSVSGAVSYRDVTPATYTIAVWTQKDFANASKTVALRPGDTIYVKVESFRAWESGGGDSNFERDTFIVVIVDSAEALGELAHLHYLRAEARRVQPGSASAVRSRDDHAS
jgi:hypothetical protein